jgi:hypothetical protein
MSIRYTYNNNEEISVGDLITVDYGYEHCIVLKLFFYESDLELWGWTSNPGPGVFAYSYRNKTIDYIPLKILQSKETGLLGRCKENIFRDNII